MTGNAINESIKVIRPAGLSKAAHIDKATDPSRKNMNARSQSGGLTVSEKMIFSSLPASMGLTLSDFQVTLSV